MAKVLVDTDVVIEVLRGTQDVIRTVRALWKKGNAIFCCPITIAEVYHGLRPDEMGETDRFFRSIECLPITKEAGAKAGEYLDKYHKTHGVELGDDLVAAVCFSNKTRLYTLNKKHYPMKDIRMVLKAG
jgi:predicted nucleic acid-binding protein